MRDIEVHPLVEPIAELIGTWRGSGRGEYPRVSDFTYEEESTFAYYGRPFLYYVQRTWSPDGAPMHSETGYWRPRDDGSIEVILAHSLGVSEVSEGSFSTGRIDLETSSLASSSSAKKIKALRRHLRFEKDMLTYELEMAYEDVPLQHHLRAELKRS